MPYNVLDPSTAATAPTTTAGEPLTSVGETLTTFLAELEAELGSRNDVDPARFTMWLNWAYRYVAGMVRLTEMQGSVGLVVVADQPFYALPIQVASIRGIGASDATTYPIDEGRELAMIDLQGYRTLPELTDIPTSYFRYRRMVVIWPTPSLAFTAPLDFRIRPDDLVEATDSPILPPEFHEPILLFARHRALRSLRLWKEAALAQNDALAAIRPLINTDAEESEAQNAVLQPVKSTRGLYRGRA